MLIIASKVGQLANRLFLFSHFIANAIEYNYCLVNPNFFPYHCYFKGTLDPNFFPYPIFLKYQKLSSIINKLTWINSKTKIFLTSPYHSLVLANSEQVFDLNHPDFLDKVNHKNLVLAYGWLFRDYTNLQKHHHQIKAFFEPLDCHQQKIKELIFKCRQECDYLIGVHLRKGDYQTWQNGLYYFEDTIYLRKMQECAEILTQDTSPKIGFILCSNEVINYDMFSSLKIYPSLNDPLEDLYTLSQCDYIIGPPSTYSGWASFYGNVPLYQIKHPNQKVHLDHFSCIKG